MVKNSDTTSYTVAHSLKYGYDKQYTSKCVAAITLLKLVMPIAKKLLDLPDNLNVHLKPTKLANAYYHHDTRRIVIDPRRCETYASIIAALMHELVHAEQFKQGRLSLGLRTMKWMGKPVKQVTRDYEKYRAQPWEAEAFGREKELCDKVHKALRRKFK